MEIEKNLKTEQRYNHFWFIAKVVLQISGEMMVCSIYVTENFGNLYRKYETTFCLYHRKFNYSELVNDRVKENNKLLAD